MVDTSSPNTRCFYCSQRADIFFNEAGMPVTIGQLEIFNAGVESGQVTKAAKGSLLLSQSQVLP